MIHIRSPPPLHHTHTQCAPIIIKCIPLFHFVRYSVPFCSLFRSVISFRRIFVGPLPVRRTPTHSPPPPPFVVLGVVGVGGGRNFLNSQKFAEWIVIKRYIMLLARHVRISNHFRNFQNFYDFVMTIEKNYVHYVHDSIIKKSCSGLGLNIMQGNFTVGTLWFSTDLTFYYWNMMNQYWFTMALGSGWL